MIIRIKIGHWRLSATIGQVESVYGINSKLKTGGHILMWDFDNSTLEQCATELKRVQTKHNLPPIYIMQTRPDKSFIAYCFKHVTYQQMLSILAETQGICISFLRISAWRMHCTLRVTPKSGRKIIPTLKLPSPIMPDATVYDLQNWTLYETLSDNSKRGIFEITKGGRHEAWTLKNLKRH